MLRRPGAAHAVRFLALVGVAALVAACGSTVATAPPTSGSLLPSATSSAGPSAAPSASATIGSPQPSVEPGGSPFPQGSEAPSPSAGPSPQPGSSDACSGTAENRDFYAALAASVAWDVYCPVLPPGWFVASGSYRLSSGGQLTITYRGPGGAEIDVREGGYCAGQSDCIPSGSDAGSASFGDLPARLLALGNGSWMVVVAPPGGDAAWQATGTGMDGPALAAYTAAFAHVVQ
jgi:hypothetical protein